MKKVNTYHLVQHLQRSYVNYFLHNYYYRIVLLVNCFYKFMSIQKIQIFWAVMPYGLVKS